VDIWAPEEYVLLLDGHVVATAPEFEVAFCMLFASYFSFHTCYAQQVSSTLEFIQRALFGINPDRGSKAKKRKNASEQTSAQPVSTNNGVSVEHIGHHSCVRHCSESHLAVSFHGASTACVSHL
ncbi:uncharacterized protein ISCGN_032912, partial [Ixodes scapularis]